MLLRHFPPRSPKILELDIPCILAKKMAQFAVSAGFSDH